MTPRNPAAFCEAKNRRGSPCRRGAGWGTGHPGVGRCKLHGGASPQAELSAAAAEAREEARALGLPVLMHPGQAVLQAIAIANGEVRYATDRLAELSPDELVTGAVATTTRPRRIAGGAEAETETVEVRRETPPHANVWIRVRHDAMDRVVRYSAVAMKADIDMQDLLLPEAIVDLLAQAMRSVVQALGHDPDDPEVRQLLREQLDVHDDRAPELMTGSR